MYVRSGEWWRPFGRGAPAAVTEAYRWMNAGMLADGKTLLVDNGTLAQDTLTSSMLAAACSPTSIVLVMTLLVGMLGALALFVQARRQLCAERVRCARAFRDSQRQTRRANDDVEAAQTLLDKRLDAARLLAAEARSRLIRHFMHDFRSPLLVASSAAAEIAELMDSNGRDHDEGELAKSEKATRESVRALQVSCKRMEKIVADVCARTDAFSLRTRAPSRYGPLMQHPCLPSCSFLHSPRSSLQMIDFEKCESLDIVLEYSPFTIAQLAATVWRSCAQTAAVAGVALRIGPIDPSHALTVVIGDLRRLALCVEQCVLNAIDASPVGVSALVAVDVSVETSVRADHDDSWGVVHVAISDVGSGICAEDLAALNSGDVFTDTLGGAQLDGRGGTGLGLARTRSILSQHNDSRLSLSSDGAGCGTTAKLTLNLKLGDTPSASVQRGGPSAGCSCSAISASWSTPEIGSLCSASWPPSDSFRTLGRSASSPTGNTAARLLQLTAGAVEPEATACKDALAEACKRFPAPSPCGMSGVALRGEQRLRSFSENTSGSAFSSPASQSLFRDKPGQPFVWETGQTRLPRDKDNTFSWNYYAQAMPNGDVTEENERTGANTLRRLEAARSGSSDGGHAVEEQRGTQLSAPAPVVLTSALAEETGEQQHAGTPKSACASKLGSGATGAPAEPPQPEPLWPDVEWPMHSALSPATDAALRAALPRQRRARSGAGVEAELPPPRPIFPPSFRVLYAEDDAVLRRSIVLRTFKALGVPVDEAVDGRDALRRFSEADAGHYSLILLDNMMVDSLPCSAVSPILFPALVRYPISVTYPFCVHPPLHISACAQPNMTGAAAAAELRARGFKGKLIGMTADNKGSRDRDRFEASGIDLCVDKDSKGVRHFKEVLLGCAQAAAAGA